MRTILTLILGLTLTSCITAAGMHPGLHPSMVGDSNAAGINTGVLYSTMAESDFAEGHILQFPYGEGFVRFGIGTGQLELRVTPALGYVGYRANIMSAQDGSVGLALKPSFGLGYWNFNDGGEDSAGQLTIAPNLAVIVSFADGAAYVAPRFGYLHVTAFQRGESDSTGQLAMGGNVGFVVDGDPWDIVLELGFQRVTSTEENDEGAIYVIAPTVGIQL